MSIATVPHTGSEPLSQELEQIFREHGRLIYRTAYGVTGSVEDAQDILQTVLLRLLQREFPPDLRKNPSGYFYRAAVNLALDVVRKRSRRIVVGEEVCLAVPAPAADSHAEEMHQRLYVAIAALNPQTAHIVILRYLHDYSDAAIAKMLGKSRTTVAVRLFRARARLKTLLRGETS